MGASHPRHPRSGHPAPEGRPSRDAPRWPTLAVGIVAAVALVGCGSEDAGPTTPEVTPAEAYTAIVRWEADQREPIVDENGDIELPIVYLTAENGGTIDIGVQADVVAATADDVTVRFSDDADDAIDDGIEGNPVHDDGVMFVLGDLPDGDAALLATVRRYSTEDDQETLVFEIVASDEGAKVVEATEQADPTG